MNPLPLPAVRVQEAVSRARVIVPPLKNLPQRPKVQDQKHILLEGPIWSSHLSAEQQQAFKDSSLPEYMNDALRTFALYKQYAMYLHLLADGFVIISNVSVRPNHRPCIGGRSPSGVVRPNGWYTYYKLL